MQDIAGLRAIVDSVPKVRKLQQAYKMARFKHKLVSEKNYIDQPKGDGYRSIHLIFKYENNRETAYNGLSLELQFRSRLQHAWATAVETMGTFLGEALKSGQGDGAWRTFFTKASAALTIVERTKPIPGFENKTPREVYEEVSTDENRLGVLDKLRGFAIAANQISTEKGTGAYHLITLNSTEKSVQIKPYSIQRLDQASLDYAAIEKRTKDGEPIEAVLVSAGPIDQLKKAYPNYFLDTEEFVSQIQKVIAKSRGPQRLLF